MGWSVELRKSARDVLAKRLGREPEAGEVEATLEALLDLYGAAVAEVEHVLCDPYVLIEGCQGQVPESCESGEGVMEMILNESHWMTVVEQAAMETMRKDAEGAGRDVQEGEA